MEYSEWHHISDLNVNDRTAMCSRCGPVEVRSKNGKWRCREGLRASDRRRYHEARDELESSTPRPKDGRCAICRKKQKLVWDHCHKTGLHRGWLCNLCNSLLGFAKDDVRILQRAIDYLS